MKPDARRERKRRKPGGPAQEKPQKAGKQAARRGKAAEGRII